MKETNHTVRSTLCWQAMHDGVISEGHQIITKIKHKDFANGK